MSFNEIEGMCQRENNPTKEQKPAEGHQWVFNTARKFRIRRRPLAVVWFKRPNL